MCRLECGQYYVFSTLVIVPLYKTYLMNKLINNYAFIYYIPQLEDFLGWLTWVFLHKNWVLSTVNIKAMYAFQCCLYHCTYSVVTHGTMDRLFSALEYRGDLCSLPLTFSTRTTGKKWSFEGLEPSHQERGNSKKVKLHQAVPLK